jgi:uncharacterized Rmd1/YagE family protein
LLSKSKAKSKRFDLLTSEEERYWKRIKQQKMEQLASRKDNKLSITGYAVSSEIEINNVKSEMISGNFLQRKKDECFIFYNNLQSKYIFIFKFGVVIFWNFSEYGETRQLKLLNSVMVKPLKANKIEKDFMIFDVDFVENSKIEDNTIYLQSEGLEEKFGHAYAFAQSLKLEIFETKISKTMEKTKSIPKNLAKKGVIDLQKKDVYKMIGKIFMLRSSVNFLTGMLDVPDCFWDNDEIEKVYMDAREYYDIDDRIEIINSRLSLIKEMYDMLNDDLHNKHANYLEWIVVILVFAELFIEIVWNILIKDIFQFGK